MKSIKEAKLENKRVILRVDFNVPLVAPNFDGVAKVKDDRRIRASLPTIKYLLKHKAKVILVTHIGRPKGVFDQSLTLDGVILKLQHLLDKVVYKSSEIIGNESKQLVDNLKPGEIMSLGNIRFDPGEEANDQGFAKALAQYGDIYVNDAFSVSHRAHASVEAITHFLPSFAGLLLEEEYDRLKDIEKNTSSPFYLILGGAKPQDKISVINNLKNKIDGLIVGGLVAANFMKATGQSVGATVTEPKIMPQIKDFINFAQKNNRKIIIPQDQIVINKEKTDRIYCRDNCEIENNDIIKDHGSKTVETIIENLNDAKTIFWNGTLGIVEEEAFENATKKLAQYLADCPTKVIVSGGDTLAAIDKFHLTEKFSNISLGGGASLEFLAGKPMPGIIALK